MRWDDFACKMAGESHPAPALAPQLSQSDVSRMSSTSHGVAFQLTALWPNVRCSA